MGELLDLELNKIGISTLKITPDMVLERTGIARGYYMFAMANTLALAVVDAEYALTAVGNVKYKLPVNAGAVLVARAVVTHRRMDKYYIFVSVKNNNEEVFALSSLLFLWITELSMRGSRKHEIAVDVMGTDYGPKELVLGAVNAVKEYGCETVLVGDEK